MSDGLPAASRVDFGILGFKMREMGFGDRNLGKEGQGARIGGRQQDLT